MKKSYAFVLGIAVAGLMALAIGAQAGEGCGNKAKTCKKADKAACSDADKAACAAKEGSAKKCCPAKSDDSKAEGTEAKAEAAEAGEAVSAAAPKATEAM